VNGQRQNPEYRITEDARLATDVPIDLVVGLLSSSLAAGAFIVILWNVGGSLEIQTWSGALRIPGYLVIASVIYATTTTLGMMIIGRNMVDVIENKNQAEAYFKYVVARVNTRTTLAPVPDDASMLATAQGAVIHQWKRLCGQHMRTTLVRMAIPSWRRSSDFFFALQTMLPEQSALARLPNRQRPLLPFKVPSIGWSTIYPRLAEWMSSAYRVGILLNAFDELDGRPLCLSKGKHRKHRQIHSLRRILRSIA
jgi:putative ATP-binding cassette transporter